MSQKKQATDTKSIRLWVVRTLRRVANGDNVDHVTVAPVLVKASTTAAQLATKEEDLEFFTSVLYAVASAEQNDYIDSSWRQTIDDVVKTITENGISSDQIEKLLIRSLA